MPSPKQLRPLPPDLHLAPDATSDRLRLVYDDATDLLGVRYGETDADTSSVAVTPHIDLLVDGEQGIVGFDLLGFLLTDWSDWPLLDAVGGWLDEQGVVPVSGRDGVLAVPDPVVGAAQRQRLHEALVGLTNPSDAQATT